MPMSLEQLMGRHFRLKQELSIAYRSQPWHSGRIDRLADDLAGTEREIANLRQAHRQPSESMPHFDFAG